jgi:hypothetical protein
MVLMSIISHLYLPGIVGLNEPKKLLLFYSMFFHSINRGTWVLKVCISQSHILPSPEVA